MNTDCIEKKIFLKAALPRVWRAISDAHAFGEWFGVRFENGEFAAGKKMLGKMTPTLVDKEVAALQKPHEGLKFECVIDQIDPQKQFAFRWHPFAIDRHADYSSEPMTLVTFTLQEQNNGVLLTITESGFDQLPANRRGQAFSANEGGWNKVITLVEGYLVQKP